MKKTSIEKDKLRKFLTTNKVLYASQVHEDKLLRLWITNDTKFSVEHGDEILYEGLNIDKAVNTWNKA